MWNREDVVKLLLKHGANIDLYGDWYDTPLSVAAKSGLLKIALILLEAGSDVNQKGAAGKTPLHTACTERNIQMVELLLSHGADPNILQAARGSGSEFKARTLPSHSTEVNCSSPLVTVCLDDSVEIAELLIEADADLNATNLIGHSALLATICSHKSRLELFDYLIRQGADPLQRDRRGCNGLHYAARANKTDFIQRTLDLGVDVNATDHNGWSPLHWAVASTEDSTEIVRLLTHSGCDESLRDKQGRTAENLIETFSNSDEFAIRGDIARLRIDSPHDETVKNRVCDGCEVERRFCRPERWHHCADCMDFDFCFRCILDKDIIHFKDHRFSDEPA